MLGKKGREAQVQMRTTNLMYNRVTNRRILFRPITTIFWGILHRSPDQSHIIPKLFFLEKNVLFVACLLDLEIFRLAFKPIRPRTQGRI